MVQDTGQFRVANSTNLANIFPGLIRVHLLYDSLRLSLIRAERVYSVRSIPLNLPSFSLTVIYIFGFLVKVNSFNVFASKANSSRSSMLQKPIQLQVASGINRHIFTFKTVSGLNEVSASSRDHTARR